MQTQVLMEKTSKNWWKLWLKVCAQKKETHQEQAKFC